MFRMVFGVGSRAIFKDNDTIGAKSFPMMPCTWRIRVIEKIYNIYTDMMIVA